MSGSHAMRAAIKSGVSRVTRDKAIPQLFDFLGSITETGSGFF
eukprot:COSAG06_NODE_60235_length_271_cov_1.174419_1_plen_42_part_10